MAKKKKQINIVLGSIINAPSQFPFYGMVELDDDKLEEILTLKDEHDLVFTHDLSFDIYGEKWNVDFYNNAKFAIEKVIFINSF